jgi:hypothetical protein
VLALLHLGSLVHTDAYCCLWPPHEWKSSHVSKGETFYWFLNTTTYHMKGKATMSRTRFLGSVSLSQFYVTFIVWPWQERDSLAHLGSTYIAPQNPWFQRPKNNRIGNGYFSPEHKNATLLKCLAWGFWTYSAVDSWKDNLCLCSKVVELSRQGIKSSINDNRRNSIYLGASKMCCYCAKTEWLISFVLR